MATKEGQNLGRIEAFQTEHVLTESYLVDAVKLLENGLDRFLLEKTETHMVSKSRFSNDPRDWAEPFADIACVVGQEQDLGPIVLVSRCAGRSSDLGEVVRNNFLIAKLQRENARLRHSTYDIATDLIEGITAISCELFRSDVQFVQSFDPEYPADRFFTVIVNTPLSPPEIVKAEGEWVKAIESIAPGWEALRLSIRPIQ